MERPPDDMVERVASIVGARPAAWRGMQHGHTEAHTFVFALPNGESVFVKQATDAGVQLKDENGVPYRYVPITVVRPEESLGNTLDFRQRTLMRRRSLGEEAARKALKVPVAHQVRRRRRTATS